MSLDGRLIRYKNYEEWNTQTFEILAGEKVYEHLTSIPSLLTSTVKLSRLWGANFSKDVLII